MDKLWDQIVLWVTEYGMKVVGAIVILVVGRWLAKLARGIIRNIMEKAKVDPALVSFTGSMTYIGLLTFIVIAALNTLGIQTASVIAILGAAGLAIGLALQGSLANFAAGVLMLIFKPFKVGDFIEGGGVSGIVEHIEIFTTVLKTPDNKKIIVPNAKLTGDNIVNYSANEKRRVDLTASVSYGDDIDKVKDVLQAIVKAEARILDDPAPQIAMMAMADSSLNFVVRAWVKTPDYWDVFFSLNETIKKRFDAEKISIPFPQRDVHVYQHTA